MFPLFAYIDPFTGALVYQLLVAGVVGLIVFYKKVKASVFGIFGFKPAKKADLDLDVPDCPTVQLEKSGKEEKNAA